MLTARERQLFRAAVYWAYQWDNSNPDVGMGPWPRQIAERVARGLPFDIDESEINSITFDDIKQWPVR